MRILLDTCIILDVLQKREPFVKDAQEIFRGAALNQFIGCISAKSCTDIYYLAYKCLHSNHEARVILGQLFTLFTVLDTTAKDCQEALCLDMKDYEDAVMIQTAVNNKIDCIVTRNFKDYKNSTVPVLSPSDFLQNLRFSKE